jgi:hypothetical protein
MGPRFLHETRFALLRGDDGVVMCAITPVI